MNNIPIRRFCSGGGHGPIKGMHKHQYDEFDELAPAYVPTDIRHGNVNDELMDFLQECKIRFLGNYQQIQPET